MSNQMISSELFAELPHKQQDSFAGDTDSQLAGSNYANRSASLQQTITTRYTRSAENSTGATTAVNTTVQVLLRLGALTVAMIAATPSYACQQTA